MTNIRVVRSLFRSLLRWTRREHVYYNRFELKPSTLNLPKESPTIKFLHNSTVIGSDFKVLSNAEGVSAAIFAAFRRKVTLSDSNELLDDGFKVLRELQRFGETILLPRYRMHITNQDPELDKHVTFRVGQVVQHAEFGYRGIVIGRTTGDSDPNHQMIQISVDSEDLERLASSHEPLSDFVVVSSDDLIPVIHETLLRVHTSDFSLYFQEFDSILRRYLPTDDLAFRYPLDCIDLYREDVTLDSPFWKPSVYSMPSIYHEIVSNGVSNNNSTSSTSITCSSSSKSIGKKSSKGVSSTTRSNRSKINESSIGDVGDSKSTLHVYMIGPPGDSDAAIKTVSSHINLHQLVASCHSILEKSNRLFNEITYIFRRHGIEYNLSKVDSSSWDEDRLKAHGIYTSVLDDVLFSIKAGLKHSSSLLTKLEQDDTSALDQPDVAKAESVASISQPPPLNSRNFRRTVRGRHHPSSIYQQNNQTFFKYSKLRHSAFQQFAVSRDGSLNGAAYEVDHGHLWGKVVAVSDLYSAAIMAIHSLTLTVNSMDRLLELRFQRLGVSYMEGLLRDPMDLVRTFSSSVEELSASPSDNDIEPGPAQDMDDASADERGFLSYPYPVQTTADVLTVSPEPCFEVGQVVKHNTLQFRGVIRGWDQRPLADVTSWEEMKGSKFGRNQPFYRVIPDERDSEATFGNNPRDSVYLAQENISHVSNPAEIHVRHPWIPVFFPGGFDNKTQRFIIPHKIRFCFSSPLVVTSNHYQEYHTVENALLDGYSLLKHSLSHSRLNHMMLHDFNVKKLFIQDEDFRVDNSSISVFSSAYQSLMAIVNDSKEASAAVAAAVAASERVTDFDHVSTGVETTNDKTAPDVIDVKFSSLATDSTFFQYLVESKKKIISTHKLGKTRNLQKEIVQFNERLAKEHYFQQISLDLSNVFTLMKYSTTMADALAIDTLLAWVRLSNNSVVINRLIRQAESNDKGGDQKAAYDLWKQIIDIDPFFAESYAKLAGLHMKKREAMLSGVNSKLSLKLFPENYTVSKDLGQAYEMLGQPENAVMVYEESLRINPWNIQLAAQLNDKLCQKVKQQTESDGSLLAAGSHTLSTASPLENDEDKS